MAAPAIDLATDRNSPMSQRFAAERAWAHRQAVRHAEELAPKGEMLLAIVSNPGTEAHLYQSRPGQARWALVRIAEAIMERRHAKHAPHGGFEPTPEDWRWIKAYTEIVTTSLWPGPNRDHVFNAMAKHGGRCQSRDHTAAELAVYAARLIEHHGRDVVLAAGQATQVVIKLLVTRAGVREMDQKRWGPGPWCPRQS
jgi:hypothetical protein